MLEFVSVLLFLCFVKADYSESCDVGDIVQNRCIKCVCTSKHIYDCALQDCPEENAKRNILNIETPICELNQIYVQNTTTCICNKKGTWPHERCIKIFGILRSNSSKRTCEPNSYVTIDCNVCRCSSNGEIDRDRCTRNICQRKLSFDSRKSSNIYGTCKPKHWYSLAPCQFCYCVNENKLVCNNGNYYAHNLDMGSYNLSVCGEDLIKEAKELVPEYHDIFNKPFTKTRHEDTTTKKYVKVQDNHELVINVEHNDKQKEINFNRDVTDQEEDSSESEEDKQESIINIGREGGVTQIPYQEDGDTSNETIYKSDLNEDQEDNLGSEISVDITQFNPKNLEDEKSGRSIKINLPEILNKVLKTALRKSMVSLTSDNKCVPGSAKLVKCNMCYCLKNGKLLCTENACQ